MAESPSTFGVDQVSLDLEALTAGQVLAQALAPYIERMRAVESALGRWESEGVMRGTTDLSRALVKIDAMRISMEQVRAVLLDCPRAGELVTDAYFQRVQDAITELELHIPAGGA